MMVRLLLSLCVSALTTTITAVIFYSIFPSLTLSCTNLVVLILQVILAFFTYHVCTWYLSGGKVEATNKAVLITGCDSGFGNELAKKLDSEGFLVFAACLFPDGPGAAELKKCWSGRLQVLYMDVTKDESVEKAVKFVEQNLGTNELWALVNNAGIYKGFTIEFTPVDTLKEVFEVNSFGPVRVTKAFLPLLRKSKGRVVNITSIAGRIPVFGTCAYTMSKHAAVAFTEVLSQEMNVWGVPVISIEPESFRTPMSESQNLLRNIDEIVKKVPEETLVAYGGSYAKKFKQFMMRYSKFLPLGIHFVTDAMVSAVMDKYPNHSYKPRWNFISRFVWYSSEIVNYAFFEFIQLKCFQLLGCPVPEGAKKRA